MFGQSFFVKKSINNWIVFGHYGTLTGEFCLAAKCTKNSPLISAFFQSETEEDDDTWECFEVSASPVGTQSKELLLKPQTDRCSERQDADEVVIAARAIQQISNCDSVDAEGVTSILSNADGSNTRVHLMKDCSAIAFEGYAVFFIRKGQRLPEYIDKEAYACDMAYQQKKMITVFGSDREIAAFNYVFDVRPLKG